MTDKIVVLRAGKNRTDRLTAGAHSQPANKFGNAASSAFSPQMNFIRRRRACFYHRDRSPGRFRCGPLAAPASGTAPWACDQVCRSSDPRRSRRSPSTGVRAAQRALANYMALYLAGLITARVAGQVAAKIGDTATGMPALKAATCLPAAAGTGGALITPLLRACIGARMAGLRLNSRRRLARNRIKHRRRWAGGQVLFTPP